MLTSANKSHEVPCWEIAVSEAGFKELMLIMRVREEKMNQLRTLQSKVMEKGQERIAK